MTIRAQVRKEAAGVAASYPVDEGDAAADAIQLKVARLDVELDSGEKVIVDTTVKLSVDVRSAGLQRDRRDAERACQRQVEAVHHELRSLRRQLVEDTLTARLWALRELPEPASSGSDELVDELINEANSKVPDVSVDAYAQAVTEFSTWLTTETKDGRTGLALLDDLLLSYFGERDASRMLHALAGVPDASTPSADVNPTIT